MKPGNARIAGRFDLHFQEEVVKKYFVVLFALLIAGTLFAAAQDFAGTWTSSSQAYPHTIVLRVNSNTLTGTADGLAISRGYVDNTSIQFVVVRNGATLNYKGAISNGQLSLKEAQPEAHRERTLVLTRSGN
ncbi:MAG: hypothetical protein ABFD60_07455 [Bryobacteraceae bacterium]